ncbi:MAG: hypothetical protein LUE10_08950 [Alistipes sp.]|nr:hypothetical protein [Alistipes sp.]
MESEAVLVGNVDLDPAKRAVVSQLLFRFEAVERSRGLKYVLMNLPREKVGQAVALLPGLKSPTVLPLADEGWCSLHAVIREADLWARIESLKGIGAEDILVLTMEKMIP